MNRRFFIKLTSLSFLGAFACQTGTRKNVISIDFPIKVYSNRQSGHLVQTAQNWNVKKRLKSEYLVVGAGLAGLTAAYSLRDKDMYLCELSEIAGGSASAVKWQQIPLCHGAHYDLSYPNYFGEEALSVLSEVGIVRYSTLSNRWEFNDKQYLIPHERESYSVYQNKEQEGVLPKTKAVKDFFEHTRPFLGKLKMPSRLIDKSFERYNQQSFLAYLQENFNLDEATKQAMNYQMIDDFGGRIDEVSALAGLCYYLSRPYLEEEHPFELFSPPQGNFYFVEKFLGQLKSEQILTKHLVNHISTQKKGFQVEILDLVANEKILLETQNIVYAGQKHALKYVFNQDAHLFASNQYAPWVVVNFIIEKKALPQDSYWQNEILDAGNFFIGFVDSEAQYLPSPEYRILTAYFCFPPALRNKMLEIEENPTSLVEATLAEIATYFEMDLKNLAGHTKQAVVKIMGHAMPIPIPNYLLKDQNNARSQPNLVYAGVDNQRLPLLLEAIDSGLEAVKHLHKIT